MAPATPPSGFGEVAIQQPVVEAAAPVYTQVSAPAAAPVYAQVPPAPAQGYPPPAAYPVAKSGGALKIVLIVIAVIVGLGIIGLLGAGYAMHQFAKAVHVDSNGNGASVSVPGVSISAGDSTPVTGDMGVPAYPGAVTGKGNVHMNLGSTSTTVVHFTTSDSVSDVAEFYKSKMGEGTAVVEGDSGTVLNSGGKDTDRIMVTIGPGSGDEAGKTAIVIMHSKKN